MISVSHWGMFNQAAPAPLMLRGFKIADLEILRKEWSKPNGFVSFVPLEHCEQQPMYVQPSGSD